MKRLKCCFTSVILQCILLASISANIIDMVDGSISLKGAVGLWDDIFSTVSRVVPISVLFSVKVGMNL